MDEDVDAWNAVPPGPSTEVSLGSNLAGRIGLSRVYLLEESSANIHGRLAKRKRDLLDDEPTTVEPEEESDRYLAEDGHTRTNALYLTGQPISHLATAKIFAYASQFSEPPMALEWINDTSAVLIYPKSSLAKISFDSLLKDSTQAPDELSLHIAHSVPLELWPPQSRISNVLGHADPLSGAVKIRWATTEDVKKKGAAKESKFYKMYGEHAGREGRPLPYGSDRDVRTSKRERRDGNSGSADDGGLEEGGHLRSSLMNRLGPRPSKRCSRSPSPTGRLDGIASRARGKRGNQAVSKDDLDAELESFLNEKTPDA